MSRRETLFAIRCHGSLSSEVTLNKKEGETIYTTAEGKRGTGGFQERNGQVSAWPGAGSCGIPVEKLDLLTESIQAC